MTAEQIGPGNGHDVIHLEGRVAAVVVPIEEYRLLAELRRNATAEELANAEDAAAIADWEARKAAGTARTVPADEVRRQLGLAR
jgi:hypothetical protein